MSSKIDTVEFADPPPEGAKGAPSYDWAAIAVQLTQRPADWAIIVEDGPQSTWQALRAGSIAALRPEYGFRFRFLSSYQPVDGGQRRARIWGAYFPGERLSDQRIEELAEARRAKRAARRTAARQ